MLRHVGEWVWAQMTKMLDLLDLYLDELGYKSARIDGSITWQGRQVWLPSPLSLQLAASACTCALVFGVTSHGLHS